MRIVYFGTPAFSASFLQALLHDAYFDVVSLVCQPDEPVGRKKILTAPPTKKLFQKIHPNRPIFQPTKLRAEEFTNELNKLHADAFVIVAYGRIIPQHVLDLPKLGNVNVHPSLLPKWRGPSPMQAAIAAGDTHSGVTIMLIDAEMDHGPILVQTSFALEKNETLTSFTERVIALGAPLLINELKKLKEGTTTPTEQNHTQATFCKLLNKEDGIVTPLTTAEQIERNIRAYTPWPGVRTTFILENGETQEIKLHNARVTNTALKPGEITSVSGSLLLGTNSTALEILSLQPATKNILTAKEYLQGYKPTKYI
jgi:methionyl-tRNA formyltransferase